MYHVEEFILRNTKEVSNPFNWGKIILNLPGVEFNSIMARVMKWDDLNQQVAIYMLIYIDNLKIMVPTRELSWIATRRA